MKRLLVSGGLAIALVAGAAGAAHAEVKTRDRGQVKFEGMLGRMVGLFGGKAAREGIETTTAVKGNRKITLDDSTGRIVDLSEEKVYELDLKKKTYTVTTFEEIRRQLREAEEKAAREAEKNRGDKEPEEAPKDQPKDQAPEVEVDFSVKETGQKKAIAGYDAREVVMTVTVRQKGHTLEDGGGLVMTTDSWLGPEIPALKELSDFEVRYWKAIAPEPAGVSAEQMAAVLAMYPMVKPAMDRLAKEQVNMSGTPLETVMTFETVKSAEQMQQQEGESGGGVGGMLARRMMKRNQSPRATFFTVTHQTLEVATAVPPGTLDIPAGFKEKR